MDAYIFAGDLYCEACARNIKARLESEGKAPKNPEDERSYDSEEYPKGPFFDGGGESDSPRHCGSHSDCPEVIELANGNKVGKFLENDLTEYGCSYVRGLLEDEPNNELVLMWAEFYGIETD